MNNTKKITFICLGNIGRSPSAEYIMKYYLKKEGMDKDYIIDSAGYSSCNDGLDIFYKAKEQLDIHSIPHPRHYAKVIDQKLYDESDLVLVMEEKNKRMIESMFGVDNSKVKKLLDFSSSPRDISDPYYCNNYELVYSEIEEGVLSLIEYLKKAN
jgi:protein-tyrosine phosphatase